MPSQVVVKTAFIDVIFDGEKTDAYIVLLESEDGTYGIRDAVTGEVIVEAGISPFNPTTGRYEYDFEAESNRTYEVAWKVLMVASSSPQYQLQTIDAAITEVGEEITAETEIRGRLRQGDNNAFLLLITKFTGEAVDAEAITYEILDPSGVSQTSGTPERFTDGGYVFDWKTERDADVGKYTLVWQYTVDGVQRYEEKVFVISTAAVGSSASSFYSGVIYDIRHSLSLMICCAQKIPVYFQQAQPSMDRRTYRFTKGQWNRFAGTRIYRNKKLIADGFEINYKLGSVTFDNPLTEHDSVFADYNFRWFSDEQLDRFLSNAIHLINFYPPQSSLSLAEIATSDQKYIAPVLYGAAVDALRELMMCLNWREPAEFFGGPETAKDVFGQMDTLKKNYEETLNKILEQKKNFPYAGLTRSVVTPEYTLPGGRSRWFRYLFGTGGGV